MVNETVANTLYMIRGRSNDGFPPLSGHHREAAAFITWARFSLYPSSCFHNLHSVGKPRTREHGHLGKFAHPHSSIRSLAKLGQDLIIGHRKVMVGKV